MLPFINLDSTVLKPIPFKQLLITLHFQNKQEQLPLRKLRRHIEKWSFGPTLSFQTQKQYMEVCVQLHATAALFLRNEHLPTRSREVRIDSTAGVSSSEKKKFLPALQIAKHSSVVETQLSHFTD
jgi:hypothetical protein